ncbi:MAG: GNAT family N-acetyltransferase [Candidatus Eisenbacteria bacterium]|uniref:GNAT family N-acetyltransferase n=1 Tax=Eiseniibacteriota bacterium TaxID=2212470 RepID=A0A948RWF7_UNCEI|nr:GNAT family N-acetyltransferase [Candidatus Eisenbacteria bacterium]MBU1978044.1 GNAT family N-acetyltransferase [Gammaproteobacteria bacterium]MBU2692268.1 GNAT family N-acetyltransferase [Candidatus Eisenbacteria bacterium]
MNLATAELTPKLWPQVELLFGKTGACGGCWCQAWRIEKGEDWKKVKGAVAKERMRSGILNGTTLGIIAFDGKKPIGWCTFGPRDSFSRLNRARTLKCTDSSQVWSLPCFFVIRGYRERGVARAMLKQALKAMTAKGARIAEGYPSKPNKDGKYIAAFSWTGTISLFEKAGFTTAGNEQGSKRRVRKQLRPPAKRKGARDGRGG